MLRFSRITLATATLVAGAAFAASPAGAYPRPVGFPELITTQHFQVHYKGDGLDHIVHQQAADLAAQAELAYATETSWGYPAPPDDGDGHVDIWVAAQQPGVLGSAWPDNEGSLTTTTGWVELDPSVVTDEHVVAHELFHLIQFGLWFPTDGWLKEATAEWVGFRADGYSTANGLELAPPDMSIDCIQWNTACADDNAYELGGYSRWTFWEYLSERFGATIVKDVLANQAAVGNPNGKAVTALASVLASRGATLANVFGDYVVANLTGNFTVAALTGQAPVTYSRTLAGTKTAPLGVQRVAVNHLAARYLEFDRGDGVSDGQCFSATLTLTVSMPAGLAAQPYFYWSAKGSTPTPLAVSGSTASITVPWDTCNWTPDPPSQYAGYLALPNPTSSSDAQVFTVSGTLNVDKNSIASASAPPAVSNVRGTVVDAPANDVAPSLFLYGPSLITLARGTRTLHLVVFASGPGQLEASLGDVALGSPALRAGNNDLRLKLPAAAVRALSSTKSGVLSLTSVAPTGSKGATVTRKLRLSPRRR